MTNIRLPGSNVLWAVLFILSLLVAVSPTVRADGAGGPREKLLMDAGWKFHLGDNWGLGERLDKAGDSSAPTKNNFNDLNWRVVDLPHDWAVELPFDAHANYDHGYKPVGPGYPMNSVGWYRRAFTLSEADRGKTLWLDFDGVYRDCRVFLNGYLLAHHESGYNSFRCNITDLVNYTGKNQLAVRVDASQFEGWFYEGAGIYRHVWLEKTSPLAIAPDGIFVYSSFPNNLPQGAATLHLQTQLLDTQTNPAVAKVTWQILDPAGKLLHTVKESTHALAWTDNRVERTVKVSSPVLWSPESPKLYRLITTVESDGKIVDREETAFGIRTVGFDTTNGFLLNGQPYAIKGTCNHQDHAGVGSALPDALQNFRVAQLKSMGCNAIRTSHNEPAAELLDACDRLGLLVMDENRRFGADPQNLGYLSQQVRRDRNHPSVFIWSLANEEHAVQQSELGARVFATMQDLVHQLDPTRLCTAAMDGRSEGKADGFSSVMDVQGFNYIHRGDMDKFHEANPTIPCIGTEEASAYDTRGVFENTSTYKSAFDNKPDYGTTAEEWWTYYSARPWASGSFVWTGFDYRGEASPFQWPNISSEFGILDTCGFPKDVFYYYQSWWTDKPVLHLLPHWNWPGREGQGVEVRCYSNCKTVELFLNGQSLGRQMMPKNSHLTWMVKYQPGVLSAKGYNEAGQTIAETKVETTGVPAAVQLTPDRPSINADGADLSAVTVSITDAQGRLVPDANRLVHFEISGPGKIIGVGNGDPICHEPDICLAQYPSHSVAINDGWRMQKVTSMRRRQRPEFSTNYDDSAWAPVNVQGDDGQLQEHEQAIFRSQFPVNENDLTNAAAVELSFDMIDDDGYIFVNGHRVGQTHVYQMPALFEVKSYLHPGTNTIAVGVVNFGGPGGLTKGVTLEYGQPPIPPHWQRSTFNGLAQVLVQSTREPGEIKLTATAEGLTPVAQTIESTESKLQASVP